MIQQYSTACLVKSKQSLSINDQSRHCTTISDCPDRVLIAKWSDVFGSQLGQSGPDTGLLSYLITSGLDVLVTRDRDIPMRNVTLAVVDSIKESAYNGLVEIVGKTPQEVNQRKRMML